MNREAPSGFVRQMGMGGQSGEGELRAEREDRRCASLQATGAGVWCGGEGAAGGVQVRKGYGGWRGPLSWVTWARRRSPTGESKTGARWTSQEATRGCPDQGNGGWKRERGFPKVMSVSLQLAVPLSL